MPRVKASSPRSGRFKSEDASAGLTIITGHTGALCRVINTGENTFRVVVGGGSALELLRTCSLDVAVSGTIVINTAAPNQPIEGVYEYLQDDTPVRSGRFKFRGLNTGDRRKIIDLSGATPTVSYRILNAGVQAFEVRRGSAGGTGALVAEVVPRQALDFEATGGGNQDIFIRNHLAAVAVVEGIYDYLGKS